MLLVTLGNNLRLLQTDHSESDTVRLEFWYLPGYCKVLFFGPAEAEGGSMNLGPNRGVFDYRSLLGGLMGVIRRAST